MRKTILFFTLILLLTGCATSSYLKTVDWQEPEKMNFQPTDKNKIEVFCLDSINRGYKIIGKVMASADAGEDAKASIDYLKKEAALIGADAIINLRLQFSAGYWAIGIKSTGTAVKYTNQ